MRADDCIERVQQLASLCRKPGVLTHIWGTRNDSREGLVGTHMPMTPNSRPQDLDDFTVKALARLFDRATPYYVDNRLLEAIEVAAPAIPDRAHLRADLFPTEFGCLLFDRPVREMPHRLLEPVDPTRFPLTEPAPMCGFAWEVILPGTHVDNTGKSVPVNEGVILSFLYSWEVDHTTPSFWGGQYVGIVPLAVVPWIFTRQTLGEYIHSHNVNLREPAPPENTDNAARFEMSARIAVATLFLMSQTLTERTHYQVDRPARRRAAKTNWQHEPVIQVVKLRRIDYVAPRDTPEHIDWQCRWWVSPHWRTLHRGMPDERTVLVSRYIKGPPGKPIKPPSIRVFGLVR